MASLCQVLRQVLFLPHAGLPGPGRLSSHESIGALIRALEARDPYTGEHSRRVTAVACQFGGYLSLPPADVAILRTAGQLHDLGKVGIRDAILLKPDSFTPEEREIIQTPRSSAKKLWNL
jgi:HD-GYP domain-containing protein (c-di-GMP phosphodiesterase class II)